MVCHLLAPMASDPSRRLPGTARRLTSDMLMMVGRIMIARMIPAAKMEKPRPPIFSRMNGTSSTMPTKPKMTEGIPREDLDAPPHHDGQLMRREFGQKDRTSEADRYADQQRDAGGIYGGDDHGQDAVDILGGLPCLPRNKIP